LGARAPWAENHRRPKALNPANNGPAKSPGPCSSGRPNLSSGVLPCSTSSPRLHPLVSFPVTVQSLDRGGNVILKKSCPRQGALDSHLHQPPPAPSLSVSTHLKASPTLSPAIPSHLATLVPHLSQHCRASARNLLSASWTHPIRSIALTSTTNNSPHCDAALETKHKQASFPTSTSCAKERRKPRYGAVREQQQAKHPLFVHLRRRTQPAHFLTPHLLQTNLPLIATFNLNFDTRRMRLVDSIQTSEASDCRARTETLRYT
jgi:hypothetical protein